MPTTLILRRPLLLVAAGLAVAALAAVLLLARGDQPASAASATTVRLSANPHGKLKFNKNHITVSHGKVTLLMTNPSGSGLPHAIAVEGQGVDKDGRTAAPGRSSRVTVTLKRGTYEFYCPVDGHKAAGMKGKLVVR